MSTLIYRGYEIEHKLGGWQIYKGGKHVCQQPSEEFAYKWIDRELKPDGRAPVPGTTPGDVS